MIDADLTQFAKSTKVYLKLEESGLANQLPVSKCGGTISHPMPAEKRYPKNNHPNQP